MNHETPDAGDQPQSTLNQAGVVTPAASVADLDNVQDLGEIAQFGTADDLGPLPSWIADLAKVIPVEDVVRTVVDRDTRIAFPDLINDSDFSARLEASVRENFEALNNVLCGVLPLSQVRLREPVTFAAFQAASHLPQTSLQRSYRVGFFTFWHEWSRWVTKEANARNLSREESMWTLIRLTQIIVSYQDHVASQVAQVYAEAEAELRQSSAHLRRRLVKQLLSSSAESLTAADLATIGYDLSGWHVAVLLPGVGDSDPESERVVQRLRSELSIRQVLKQPLTPNSCVIWMRRNREWDRVSLDIVGVTLGEIGIAAVVSECREGMDGLRTTYKQTVDVDRVRSLTDANDIGSVIHYRDVALEILLMQDLELAQSFVNRELGGLAAHGSATDRLCETLEVSYSVGTHTAAADALGVHEHTVRNRLRRVEEILERDTGERRAETQVALRLRRLLEHG